MIYIFIFLLAWWGLSAALAFRKGVFVKMLQDNVPVLFMLPAWFSVTIIFLCMVVVAPYVMLEPFVVVREWWRNRQLRRIAKGIRKMAETKNPALTADLKKIADALDQLSKQ